MAYNPGVQDRSGEILAQGISQGFSSLTQGVERYYKKKEEKEILDSAVTSLMSQAASNPRLAPFIGGADMTDRKAVTNAVKGMGGGDVRAGVTALGQSMRQFNIYNQQEQDKEDDQAAFNLGMAARANNQDALKVIGGSGAKISTGIASIFSQLASADAVTAKNLAHAARVPVKPNLSFQEANVNAAIAAFQEKNGRVPNASEVQGIRDQYNTARTMNLPEGYEPNPDGQGIRPMKGSKQAGDQSKIQEAKDAKTQAEVNRAETVIGTIRSLRPRVSGFTAGFGGTMLNKIPGTDATDVAAMIDTIKANVGFEQLQQMRDASPTGGALGALVVEELKMLQASLGNLGTNQSPVQLNKHLGDVEKHYGNYLKILNGVDPRGADGGASEVRYDANGKGYVRGPNGEAIPVNR